MRTALPEPDTAPQQPAPDPAPATPANPPAREPDPDTQVEQALHLLDTATAQARILLHENWALLPNAMLATTRNLLATTTLIVRNLEGWVLDMAPAAHNDVTQMLDSAHDAIRHTGAAQALVELSQPRDRA